MGRGRVYFVTIIIRFWLGEEISAESFFRCRQIFALSLVAGTIGGVAGSFADESLR